MVALHREEYRLFEPEAGVQVCRLVSKGCALNSSTAESDQCCKSFVHFTWHGYRMKYLSAPGFRTSEVHLEKSLWTCLSCTDPTKEESIPPFAQLLRLLRWAQHLLFPCGPMASGPQAFQMTLSPPYLLLATLHSHHQAFWWRRTQHIDMVCTISKGGSALSRMFGVASVAWALCTRPCAWWSDA